MVNHYNTNKTIKYLIILGGLNQPFSKRLQHFFAKVFREEQSVNQDSCIPAQNEKKCL
jgi:hypothetical protein